MSRHVVILGAGITGALLAWRMARAGWRVTIVEARHVGAGSSSRTAAGIRQQFSTRETVLGMRFSVDFYRRFCQEVGGDVVPIVQNGYLFLYDTPEAWASAQGRVAMQQTLGLTEVEALAQADLEARFPFVARGSLLGGTWCPTDGFLRPEVVYNEAITSAVASGAVLLQNAPVTGARHDGAGRLTAVETPRGVIEGDLFVDATNAWSPRSAAILGATVLPIAPLKRYLWFIERAGTMSEATFATLPLTIVPSGAYCRPENSSTLLTGFAHNAPPEPAFSYEDQDAIAPAFFHKSGPDSFGYEAWMMLAEALPPIGELAGITATTSGYYGSTPDHNPFLDYDPQVPNLLRLVGFSGHGAMFGPFTALVGATLAEGRTPSVDALGQRVDLAPFRILRPFDGHESMVI